MSHRVLGRHPHGLAVLTSFSFSLREAVALVTLFATQLFFTSTEARLWYAGGYLVLTVGLLAWSRGSRLGFLSLFSFRAERVGGVPANPQSRPGDR